MAGAFVHQRHLGTELPRFAGWWGHDKRERFKMERAFKPMLTAEAWQVSNAPVLPMAVHRVALEQFDRAGMERLRAKSIHLTGYLRWIIEGISAEHGNMFNIITPKDPAQNGAQLSILVNGDGRGIFDRLTARGVFCDWREPDVLRMAPVPMYNSFEDVYRFGEILNECVRK